MPVYLDEYIDRQWSRLRSFASREGAAIYATAYIIVTGSKRRVRLEEVEPIREPPDDHKALAEAAFEALEHRDGVDPLALAAALLTIIEPENS